MAIRAAIGRPVAGPGTARQGRDRQSLDGGHGDHFCILLAVFDSPLLLRWYPVLISVFMLGLFILSLKYGPPMVERLARLREPQLPAKAVVYTRQVTVAWCVFFLCNGLLAAALTLWAPLSWWMLYTGLISYGLMGLMFAIEWLIRQRVRGRP